MRDSGNFELGPLPCPQDLHNCALSVRFALCAEDKPAVSADEKPVEFAEEKPVVSAEDKPVVSADKKSVVCQDIPQAL